MQFSALSRQVHYSVCLHGVFPCSPILKPFPVTQNYKPTQGYDPVGGVNISCLWSQDAVGLHSVSSLALSKSL